MKTVHIRYFADTQATELIHDYNTGESATPEAMQEWQEWMEDGATEHPEEPASYAVYDVVAA